MKNKIFKWITGIDVLSFNQLKLDSKRYKKLLTNYHNIDLNRCNKGDILISSHGMILIYKGKNNKSYCPHIVYYLNEILGDGTRNDNGTVFKKMRLLHEDQDIVAVYSPKEWGELQNDIKLVNI